MEVMKEIKEAFIADKVTLRRLQQSRDAPMSMEEIKVVETNHRVETLTLMYNKVRVRVSEEGDKLDPKKEKKPE